MEDRFSINLTWLVWAHVPMVYYYLNFAALPSFTLIISICLMGLVWAHGPMVYSYLSFAALPYFTLIISIWDYV